MSKIVGLPTAPVDSLWSALQTLPDVRRGHGKVHPLDGKLALVLVVCALLCDGRSLYAISQPVGLRVRADAPRGAGAAGGTEAECGEAASRPSPASACRLRAGAG